MARYLDLQVALEEAVVLGKTPMLAILPKLVLQPEKGDSFYS